MFFNETLLLVVHDNEQILSTCGNTISKLLFIHFCYTWFVTSFALILPVIVVATMSEPLFTCFELYQQRLGDFSMSERDDSRSAALHRSILHDIRLMSMYVSFTLIFTLFTNHGSVQLIRIPYWLIEASSAPLILISIFSAYWNYIFEYSVDYSCPLPCLWLSMLRGTVFVWMRYTEWGPSSILNDFQAFVFYYFCNPSKLHQMPNNHFLHRFLSRSERLSMLSQSDDF